MMTHLQDSDGKFENNSESMLNTESGTCKDVIHLNNSSKLNIHIIQLSNLFKANHINDICDISNKNKVDLNQIEYLIQVILSDLEKIGKNPTSNISSNPQINEAYQILSFSLMYIKENQMQNNEHNSNFKNLPETMKSILKKNEDLLNENRKLKAKLARLAPLNKNDSYFRPFENSTEFINFLADEYNLEQSKKQIEKNANKSFSSIDMNKSTSETLSELDIQLDSLKNRIGKLHNQLSTNDDYASDNVQSLLSLIERYKEESQRLIEDNNNLSYQLKVAIQDNIALSTSNSGKTQENDELNNARIIILKSNLKAIKNKYNELSRRNMKQKDRIENISGMLKLASEKLKEKDDEISKLKLNLNKIMLEYDNNISKAANNNDKSTSLNKELKLKEDENIKYKKAFDELYTQMNSLTKELQLESNNKNCFYEIIQKQTLLINKYESILKTNEMETEKNKESISKYSNQIKQMKKEARYLNYENIEKEILGDISNYLSDQNIPNEINKGINEILNNDANDLSSKIVALLEYLISTISDFCEDDDKEMVNEQNFLDEQNNRLIAYCSNLIQFFEQLANSGEMQKWIIGSTQDDNFRPLLLAQCNRIEDFLKKYTDLPLNYEDFIDFPSRVGKILQNCKGYRKNKELILILQLCATANDALRRYAHNLSDSNRHLIVDIQELRHEIKQINTESLLKIDEVTNSTNSKIQKEKRNSGAIKKVLLDVHQNLYNFIKTAHNSNETDINDAISKCLKLINSVCKDELNDKIIHEIKILAQNRKNKENEQHMKEINSLKTSNKELKKQIQSLKNELSNITQDKIKLKETLKEANKEMNQLQKTIENQNKVEQTNPDIELQLLNQKENENQISALKNEINNWKKKYEELQSVNASKKKQIKKEFKIKEKFIQSELEKQKNQNDEIKKQYEEIISQYTEKLNESRKNEANLKEIGEKTVSDLKNIQSELSSTRVEIRMLKMKVASNEEKLHREKNLMETQFKMALLNSETKQQTILEKERSQYDSQSHELYVLICEKFKEYFDFSQVISRESVIDLLDNVRINLQRTREHLGIVESYVSEMNTIRVILGINNSDPIVPSISKIVKKLVKLQDIKKHLKEIISANKQENVLPINQDISNNDNNNNVSKVDKLNAYEWEQWALKLYSIISDNFKTYLSPKALQFALEEALMAGLSQRLVVKRLDTLRTEKAIFSSLISKITTKNISTHILYSFTSTNRSFTGKTKLKDVISINTLLVIMSAIRRIRINSGQLLSHISKPESNENTKSNEKEKNQPIIPTID